MLYIFRGKLQAQVLSPLKQEFVLLIRREMPT